MDRDDNRARGERSLSEPGGSSVGHGLLRDTPRVCEATAVGTGVKLRHRIGGTAATDGRAPDRTAEAVLVGGPSGVRRRRAAGPARPQSGDDASSRARTPELTRCPRDEFIDWTSFGKPGASGGAQRERYREDNGEG